MTEFDPKLSPEEIALWMEGRLKGHDLTPPVPHPNGWSAFCRRCRSAENNSVWRFTSSTRRARGWFVCDGKSNPTS